MDSNGMVEKNRGEGYRNGVHRGRWGVDKGGKVKKDGGRGMDMG